MHLANRLRLGTFGLVAILFTQSAAAEWLDRIFRPAAFEELSAPANEPADSPLPPPPEPLPPAAEGESVLVPPEFDDDLNDQPPISFYDQAPYETGRPSAGLAPVTPQESDVWPSRIWPSPRHPYGRDGHVGSDSYRGFRLDRLGWGDSEPSGHACCEEPRITYWNHPLLAKELCGCHNAKTINILLTVPTDCCSVEVPVCVTACCDSVPEFESSRDILGRKTYDYCWPCGQRVKIVDRHTGTLVVHTYQRE